MLVEGRIEGHCFTNIDEDKKIDWPRVFVAVPRIGERVSSVDGKHSRKVCGIEYAMWVLLESSRPIVRIELTK